MSPRTCLIGLVLAACTAPPREPPPPPAIARVRVDVEAVQLKTDEVEARAVAPLTARLAAVPGVQTVAGRVAGRRAEIFVSGGRLADIRAAVAQASLPAEVAEPDVTAVAAAPALVVRLRGPDEWIESITGTLADGEGVEHVRVCGGVDLANEVALDLDLVRRAKLPVDELLATLDRRIREHEVEDRPLEHQLAHLELPCWYGEVSSRLCFIAGYQATMSLRDIADIAAAPRPRPCAAADAGGETIVASIYPRGDADPSRVAATARAILATPPERAEVATFPDAGEPLVVALEVAPQTDIAALGAALSRCLGALESPGEWAVTIDGETPEAQLVLAESAQHIRVHEALSRCSLVRRAAVLAPYAVADHRLILQFFGTSDELDSTVAIAHERLARAPGVTRLRVHGAAPDTGVQPRFLHLLALGPEHRESLQRLVAGRRFVETRDGQHVRITAMRPPDVPVRLTIDGRPAAALELRLRRASDRADIEAALTGLSLADGIELVIGDTFALP